MSLLFVELKMRGEFPEHGRKVEILIEQAAEQAYHSAVYRRDDESAPPDALEPPEKCERHYRRDGEAGEVEAGFKARQLYAVFSADALDEEVIDLRIEIGLVKQRDGTVPRAKSSILIVTDILPGGVTAGSKNGIHRHRSSAAP